MSGSTDNKQTKALIFGIDGGTWSLLDHYMAAGHMPALQRLVGEGVRGPLRSTVPPLTSAAWTSFQTGKTPGKHGVLGFSLPSVTRGFVNSTSIQGKTLWQHLSDFGMSVGVVNCPVTYPPYTVNGFMITCLLTPPGATNFTYPPELAGELPGYRIDVRIQNNPYGFLRADQKVDAESFWKDLAEVTERRTEAGLRLLRERRPDVFMIAYTGMDRISHLYWTTIDPNAPGFDEGHPHVRETVKYLRSLDEAIAGFAEAAPGAPIFFASDHGFRAHPTLKFHMNVFLMQLGLMQTTSEKGVAASQSLLRHLVPEPLARRLKTLLKRMAPERAQQLKAAIATPIDWKRTEAFGVQMYAPYGGVRMNLSGREPNGIVQPGAAYEAARDRIIAGLGKVRDDRDRPVIKEAWRREDLFPGGVVEQVPDVIFEVHDAFIPSNYFFDRAEVVTSLEVGNLTGIHAMDGIFLAVGPGLRRGARLEGASITDLAPTVLYALGKPVPSDMDGKVLLGAFTDEHAAAHRVERIDVDGSGAREAYAYSAEEQEVIEERLRALGYFD
ncbi:MAG: alkaline phosphatase family protein [Deltaproteobacteria bacterium]|nr:alkaline phosphatase family protein [Deltaproteobacteria bacterium]